MQDWINAPFFEALTYFTNTMGFFLHKALRFGQVMALIGIIWNSIQLMFGVLDPHKFLIGQIMKFTMFFLILEIYPAVCIFVQSTAQDWGKSASGTANTTIVEQLEIFKNDIEKTVIAEYEDIKDELYWAREDARLTDLAIKSEFDEENISIFDKIPYKQAQTEQEKAHERLETAQARKDNLKDNPTKNMKIFASINEILKPAKDDEGNLTDRYFIDLHIPNTQYLSPSSIFKLSILCGQIMWEKEWASIDAEQAENKENGSWTQKYIPAADFPLYRVGDLILCFICQICIIVCAIGAILQYCMAMIEFTVIIAVSILFIPAMFLDATKDFAQKVLPAIISQAVKILMITMCLYFATYSFLNITITTIGEGNSFDLTQFGYAVFVCWLALAVCLWSPRLAQALLNGQPQFSMGEALGVLGGIGAGKRIVSQGIKDVKTGVGVANGVLRTGNDLARAGITNGINTAGNIAGVYGAAQHSWNMAKNDGLSTRQALSCAYTGGKEEAGSRIKQSAQSAMHSWAHGGKRGSGGMGGAGSGNAGVNRYGYNNENYDNQNPGKNRRDFRTAINVNGTAMTAKEYIKSQFDNAQLTCSYVPPYVPPEQTHTQAPSFKPSAGTWTPEEYGKVKATQAVNEKLPIGLPSPSEAKYDVIPAKEPNLIEKRKK